MSDSSLLFSEEQSKQLAELMIPAPTDSDAEDVFIDALEATGLCTRRHPKPIIYYGIASQSFPVIYHEAIYASYWNNSYSLKNEVYIPAETLCAKIGESYFEIRTADDRGGHRFCTMMINGRIAYYDTVTFDKLGWKYITNPKKAAASKARLQEFLADVPNLKLEASLHEKKSSDGNSFTVHVSVQGDTMKSRDTKWCTEDGAWDRLYGKLYNEWFKKLEDKNLIKIGMDE